MRKTYVKVSGDLKRPCRNCGLCGGCRGRAFRRSGDFLGCDPACRTVSTSLFAQDRLPNSEPERFLPHRGRMRMITRLLTAGDLGCEAECTIRSDNPFLDESGELHPSALIEIAAQGLAYLDTFLHPYRSPDGMLVEVNRFEWSGIPVRTGNKLFVRSRKLSELEPWHVGDFQIYREQTRIAEGEFKVCQKPFDL